MQGPEVCRKKVLVWEGQIERPSKTKRVGREAAGTECVFIPSYIMLDTTQT